MQRAYLAPAARFGRAVAWQRGSTVRLLLRQRRRSVDVMSLLAAFALVLVPCGAEVAEQLHARTLLGIHVEHFPRAVASV